MATAMQELLIHFNEMNQSGWFTMDEIEQAILEIGIPAEKQQIFDAFNQGYRDGFGDPQNVIGGKDVSEFDDAKNYYNDTYGNEAAAPPAT